MSRTRLRQRPDLRVEKTLLRNGYTRLAAMDEVGRGAIAGPVSVGVVIVTATIGRVPAGLADSKLLTPAARQALVGPVRRWVPESAVGHAQAHEIDEIGIIAALRLAAWRALDELPEPADAVLLDGDHDYLTPPEPTLFDSPSQARPVIPVHTVVKGDLRCAGIAAASVLAKTTRDQMMIELSSRYPQYALAVNKGYGTAEHLAALRQAGASDIHRRTWRGVGSPVSTARGAEYARDIRMRKELT